MHKSHAGYSQLDNLIITIHGLPPLQAHPIWHRGERETRVTGAVAKGKRPWEGDVKPFSPFCLPLRAPTSSPCPFPSRCHSDMGIPITKTLLI